jgi:hypothetical protein
MFTAIRAETPHSPTYQLLRGEIKKRGGRSPGSGNQVIAGPLVGKRTKTPIKKITKTFKKGTYLPRLAAICGRYTSLSTSFSSVPLADGVGRTRGAERWRKKKKRRTYLLPTSLFFRDFFGFFEFIFGTVSVVFFFLRRPAPPSADNTRISKPKCHVACGHDTEF